jgi:hypothetical protein
LSNGSSGSREMVEAESGESSLQTEISVSAGSEKSQNKLNSVTLRRLKLVRSSSGDPNDKGTESACEANRITLLIAPSVAESTGLIPRVRPGRTALPGPLKRSLSWLTTVRH